MSHTEHTVCDINPMYWSLKDDTQEPKTAINKLEQRIKVSFHMDPLNNSIMRTIF